MKQAEVEKHERGPRGKRKRRSIQGEFLHIRLQADEKQRIWAAAAAAELAISTYARRRLLHGKVPERHALQGLAAIHAFGRRVQELAAKGAATPSLVTEIAETLAAARAAIDRLAAKLDGPDDDEPDA